MTEQTDSVANDSPRDKSAAAVKPSPKIITIPRLIAGFIVLSSPFLGYSYLRGFLEGLGFRDPHINPSTQELIFQTGAALEQFIVELIEGDTLTFISYRSVVIGLLFSFILTVFFIIAKLTSIKVYEDGAATKAFELIKPLVKKIFFWYADASQLVIKTLSIGVFSFLIGYVYIVIFGILVLLFLLSVYIFMMFANNLGIRVGSDLIQKDVCTSKPWEEGEVRRLGCSKIQLAKPFAEKEILTGIRVYSSPAVIYFVTNDGAYEISSGLNVRLFTPNQKNKTDPNNKTKDVLKVEQYGVKEDIPVLNGLSRRSVPCRPFHLTPDTMQIKNKQVLLKRRFFSANNLYIVQR